MTESVDPRGPSGAENETPLSFRFSPPKQSRSRRTLERISSAALELIEEVGLEAATVSEIVARAGSSVGSFYARFPAKEDLIRYLQQGVWTEARERWDEALAAEAWGGRTMEEVVEAVIGLLIRSLEADHHRRKILGGVQATDPQTAALILDFHDHLVSTVTELLLERRADITHPEPEDAVPFGYRVVVGAIREFLDVAEARTLVSGDGDPVPDRSGWGPELARLWIGYLSPRSTSPEDEEGAVDFFDPWG